MALEFIDAFYQGLLSLIDSMGYLGIFILMTIESTIIPFPSEIILIPAGALVAKGTFDFTTVFIMSLAGVLFGSLINYYIAFHLGRRTINALLSKYGKLLFFKPEHLIKSESYFKKHGDLATFVGRLAPGVRSFISLPAGFYKMDIGRFCVFTLLGAALPNLALIYLGYLFGTYEGVVKTYIGEISLGLGIVAALIILIYWWIKKAKRR